MTIDREPSIDANAGSGTCQPSRPLIAPTEKFLSEMALSKKEALSPGPRHQPFVPRLKVAPGVAFSACSATSISFSRVPHSGEDWFCPRPVPWFSTPSVVHSQKVLIFCFEATMRPNVP